MSESEQAQELWFSSPTAAAPSFSLLEEHKHFATAPMPPDNLNTNEVCSPLEGDDADDDDYDDDDDDDDDEILSDSEISDVDVDNDWFDPQQYDSDASGKSLETRKQNKWLCPFFDMLSIGATEPKLNEDNLCYYCPACRGSGLGETDLYKGLQPLIAHAKHFTKRRVNLHREFAAILEEDRKRISIASEPFGHSGFVGLIQEEEMLNPLIVWPPIVMIQSVALEVKERQQWLGMRSKELLEMFNKYSPVRVRHAYDSAGSRRSMTLVVFQDSALGYVQAKLLAKHFKCSERGRKHFLQRTGSHEVAQHSGSTLLLLYGYLATKEDMSIFEESDSSKKKVKWGLRRYGDSVLQPLVQMSRNLTEVHRLKEKLQEQEEHNRVLEKVISDFSKKVDLKGGSVAEQKAMQCFGELTKETSEKEA